MEVRHRRRRCGAMRRFTTVDVRRWRRAGLEEEGMRCRIVAVSADSPP